MIGFWVRQIAIFFVALYACPTWSAGQTDPLFQPEATKTACPTPAQVTPLFLYGLWRAEFDGQAQGATVLFEKHTELADSVAGGVNRDGVKTLLAGDIDEGAVTLEESDNGQNISATWTGEVVDGSCGKEIRGEWRGAAGEPALRFVLRKRSGWE
jgi:hypothetical protein